MNYIWDENKVILINQQSFKIKEILECGQCFRYVALSDSEYIVVAHGKVLRIREAPGEICFHPCTREEFEGIWLRYFDLQTDYDQIKNILSENDPVMAEAISYGQGIRLLNQDIWECLISFIISQNNRIPMIRAVIKNIAEKYGCSLGYFYSFPDAATLAGLTVEELMKCKTGFRAKYILDASRKCLSGQIDIENFQGYSTPELNKKLMEIYGVGQKVADCVMLFSCDRREVFPTDVWIKRIIQELYFNGAEMSIKEIHQFAGDKFGSLAGFAQQYLFYYARENKIGTGKPVASR